MTDIAQTWGGDLSLGPTGDLAAADTPDLTVQRVLRRLLTNPGDYIWNLAYGGGLPAFVGQPARAASIAGVVRAQLLQEAAVAPVPTPTVSVAAGPDGTVFAHVRFADAATGTQHVLSVPITGP